MKIEFKSFLKTTTSPFIKYILWPLAALTFFVFFEISEEIIEVPGGDADVVNLDQNILQWVGSVQKSFLNGPAVDLTALGSFTVLTCLSIVVLSALIMKRKFLDTLHFLFIILTSGLLSKFAKTMIGRPRPSVIAPLVEVAGYSYPSGHSLAAGAIYLTLALIFFKYFEALWQKALIFALTSFLIIGVGLSRIYLGVHYPSDVAGGLSLGIAWAFLVAAFISLIRDLNIRRNGRT